MSTMPLYRSTSSDDQRAWPLTRENRWLKRVVLAIGVIIAVLLYAR